MGTQSSASLPDSASSANPRHGSGASQQTQLALPLTPITPATLKTTPATLKTEPVRQAAQPEHQPERQLERQPEGAETRANASAGTPRDAASPPFGAAAATTPKPTALLNHPDLWRAGQLARSQAAVQPTTFEPLDAHLPGGGWPLGALTELLLPQCGIGELQLLAPALAALSARQRWVAWINPPFVPYAPALECLGVDTSKVLLIRTNLRGAQGARDERQAAKEALWAFEKASRSGTCSAVLAWINEQHLRPKDTQRLQVAAAQGQTLSCLFRPESAQSQPSMAALRLHLSAAPERVAATENGTESTAHSGQRLGIHILKRRGGWAVNDLELPLTSALPRPEQAGVESQLQRWRAERAARLEQPGPLPPVTVAPPPHRSVH